jgi:hypothetical protein
LTYGLEQLYGLESYAAQAFYRALPLEKYLLQRHHAPRAALILHRLLLDNASPPQIGQPLSTLFERDFPQYAIALFQGAKQYPTWQASLALHTLGMLLGRYWQHIFQQAPLDSAISAQIYPCLPMMPEIEQWMHEIGHNLLLNAQNTQSIAQPYIQQAVSERRTPNSYDAPMLTSC